MAEIQFIGAAVGTAAANPTSGLAFTLHGSAAVGDLAFFVWYSRASTKSFTKPANVTTVYDVNTANGGHIFIGYRYITSLSDTYGWTAGSVSNGTTGWFTSTFRNVATVAQGGPFYANSGSPTNGTTTQDPDPPSHSFSYESHPCVIAIYGQMDDNNGTYVVPTDFTDGGNWSSTLGTDGASGLAYRLAPPDTFNGDPTVFDTGSASNYWYAWTASLLGTVQNAWIGSNYITSQESIGGLVVRRADGLNTGVFHHNPSNCNEVMSSNADWATARVGSGLSAGDGKSHLYTILSNSGSSFSIYESFLEFDTSAIPSTATVYDGANVGMWLVAQATGIANPVIEIRANDYGASVTTADWIAGASLSGKALCSTIDTAGMTLSAPPVWKAGTAGGSNAATITKNGASRFVVVDKNVTDNTSPGSGVSRAVFLRYQTIDPQNMLLYVDWLEANSPQTVTPTGVSSGEAIGTPSLSQTNLLEWDTPIWVETQPAGAVTAEWALTGMSENGAVMIAGVSTGRLYLSTNGGSSWAETQPGGAADYDWRGSALDSDGSVILVSARGGRLWLSINSGSSWTQQTPGGAVDLTWGAVACDDDGSVLLAAVDGGRLYISTNTGSSWAEKQPAGAADKNWRSLACGSDGSHIMCAAGAGRAYKSVNTGANWTEVYPLSSAANYNYYNSAVSGNGAYWYQAGDPSVGLTRSSDDGDNWSWIGPVSGNSLLNIGVSLDGEYVVVSCPGNSNFYWSKTHADSWTVAATPPSGATAGVSRRISTSAGGARDKWVLVGQSGAGRAYIGKFSQRFYPTPIASQEAIGAATAALSGATVQTEAGGTGFSIGAVGAEKVVKGEAGGAGFAAGAVATERVIKKEAGSAGFAVGASATPGLTHFIATEGGPAGFSIGASATERVIKKEAGSAGFAVGASGTITSVTHFVATEGGSAGFAVGAVGTAAAKKALAGSVALSVGVTGAEKVVKKEAGTAGFSVGASATITSVIEFTATEAATAGFSINAVGSIYTSGAQPEAGSAGFSIGAAAAEKVIKKEAGSVAFSIGAAGTVGVIKKEAGSAAFSIAAVATAGVKRPLAGTAGFSVAASATVSITHFVATEAGTAGFSVGAAGTEKVVKKEAGAAGFAVGASATVGVIHFVATEAGGASFAVSASATAGLTHFVASEAGSAGFSVSSSATITGITHFVATEAGTAGFAITAGATPGGAGTRTEAGNAGFSVGANATVGVSEVTWDLSGDASFSISCSASIFDPQTYSLEGTADFTLGADGEVHRTVAMNRPRRRKRRPVITNFTFSIDAVASTPTKRWQGQKSKLVKITGDVRRSQPLTIKMTASLPLLLNHSYRTVKAPQVKKVESDLKRSDFEGEVV